MNCVIVNCPVVRRLFVFLPLVFLLGAIPAGPVSAEPVYSFGIVPQYEARKLANIWVPILRKLEEKTGLSLSMSGSSEIPQFEAAFTRGVFDFAYMNPYHATLASKHQRYIPLVRDHGRMLSGIVVVRRDSMIRDASELNGKTVAFPAPNAFGASLVVRAELDKKMGVKVKPRYVQTHSSVYLNVVLGDADAGGGIRSTFNGQKDEIRKMLRIIYETEKFPTHPVVAHPRVPEAHRLAIQKAFLEIANTEEGAALLASVPFKKIGKADDAEYQRLLDINLDAYSVTP